MLSVKALSPWTFFYRCLLSKRSNSVIKRVSIICLLGLMVSFASLIVVFSVMDGLGQSIKEKFLAAEPHIIISLKESSSQFIQEQNKKIEQILKGSGIYSEISDFYFFETTELVIRTSEGAFSGAIAKGYDSNRFKQFLGTVLSPQINNIAEHILDNASKAEYLNLSNKNTSSHSKPVIKIEETEIEGEKLFVLKQQNPDQHQKHIIMGLSLANELNLYEGENVHLIPAENLLLPPGEPIHFELAKLEYVISSHNEAWNSAYIFYDTRDFPDFKKNSSYSSGFEIRLKDPEKYLLYKNILEKHGYLVEAWPERNSAIFFALKIEKTIMSIFLSLAGLTTLLAVSCLLVLLVVQKKKEIGILMAMGFPIQKIKKLFIKVGLLLCSLGLLGGGILGWSICTFLKYFNIPYLHQFLPGGRFPIDFNVWFIVTIVICAICFSFLSSWISVRSQIRLRPSDLLKTTVR